MPRLKTMASATRLKCWTITRRARKRNSEVCKSMGSALNPHRNAAVEVPPPRNTHTMLKAIHRRRLKGRKSKRSVAFQAGKRDSMGERAPASGRRLIRGFVGMRPAGSNRTSLRQNHYRIEFCQARQNQMNGWAGANIWRFIKRKVGVLRAGTMVRDRESLGLNPPGRY